MTDDSRGFMKPGGDPEDRARDLESILEASRDLAVAAVDADLAVRYVNAAAERLFGLERAEVVGESILDLRRRAGIEAEDLEGVLAVAARNPEVRFEITVERGDVDRAYDVTVRPLDRDGGPRGWVIWAVDISRRKVVETRLMQREAQLQATLDATADAIVVFDHEGEVSECNDRFLSMIGLGAGRGPGEGVAGLAGRLLAQLDDPDAFAELLRTLGDAPAEESGALRFANGRVFEHHSSPLVGPSGFDGRVWTFRDITDRERSHQERRQLEQENRRTERLKSLEVMAGGIAHDFNNLLTGVLGHAEVAQLRLRSHHPVYAMLTRIREAAERAAVLSRQMLTFVGQTSVRPEVVELSEFFGALRREIETWVGGRTELILGIPHDLGEVTVDPVQLRELVHHLVVNATEACREVDDGRIRVEVVARDAGPEELDFDFFDASSRRQGVVEIRVVDGGEGIEPGSLDRIFEPFYSTRFTGRGLGLATVLGIVRTHHGGLRVQSTPGQGSTFSVFLPRVPKAEGGRPGRLTGTSRGQVLVVDDEPVVRELGEEVISLLGWQVVTASDGEEALARAEAIGPELELAIVDLTMPGLSGVEVHRRLKKADPGLPVVVASGFAEDEVRERFGDDQPDAFLSKPFQVAQLRTILEEMARSSSGDG